MEDEKGKNIELPPSGLPDDLSKIGIKVSSLSSEARKTSEPLPAWKAFLGICVVVILLAFLGALTPKSGTSEDAIATQAAGLTSQAVARAKASPTNTARPTVTPYPDITMTPTATHTADEEIESLKMLPAVKSVEFVERRGTDYWAGVTVWPKFNEESFAQLLMGQAIKVDGYTFRFAVRIDDGESKPLWWVQDEKTLEWSSSSEPPIWVNLEDDSATSLPPASDVKAITPKTYYVQATANVRTCERLNCSIVATLKAGDQVTVDGTIDGEVVQSSGRWYHVNINGTEGYIYNNLLDIVKPAAASNSTSNSSSNNNTTVVIPQSVPTTDGGFVCPSNCDEAVSMGLSDVQAATCPGLDRDQDGVACYGD